MTHNRHMSNYDAYLEAPYQTAYAKDDAYVEWCEVNDLDPNDGHYDAFDEAMADEADDYAAEQAEAAREDAYFDRD